jgi:hypothetical protein
MTNDERGTMNAEQGRPPALLSFHVAAAVSWRKKDEIVQTTGGMKSAE